MGSEQPNAARENDSPASPAAAAAGTIALGELVVNRLGFGAMRLPLWDLEATRALLERALELGVEVIDTADVYGAELNERRIAEALHPYPQGLVIATKGGQVSADGLPRPDCRPEWLREACEASLRRLRLDTIDLYQLHNPDPAVPLEESLGVLGELRTEGKVRAIGVSNFFREDLTRALAAAPIASVQNQYNLTSRTSEPEVEECARQGIAFMPWFPLAAGELAHPNGPLAQVAADHEATPSQVALAWLLQRSPAMLPIPGTSSLEHLEQNARAAELRLSGEQQELLDRA